MTKKIVILVDDSSKTAKMLPVLLKRIREITYLRKEIIIDFVYLYTESQKPILSFEYDRIVEKCYCMRIDAKDTNFQKLSLRIYDFLVKENPNAIFSSASAICKECMAALAFLFNTGLAADCSGITLDDKDGKYCFERMIGEYPPKLAIVKVANSFPQMATFININMFESDTNRIFEQHKINHIIEIPHSCNNISDYTRCESVSSEGFPQYSIYFVLGAGVASLELAEKLRLFALDRGIGFGVTRQIVNRGWYDESFLIGISGRTIAPNVCFVYGVSGAYQNYIGIKDSRYIVSINNDILAPINKYAHKSIISDVNKVIVQMTS